MSTRIITSPEIKLNKSLYSFLKSIPNVFSEEGKTLYAARNTIKAFVINNTTIVVKQYKRLSIVRKFIYSFLRSSKAKRAYFNAIELRKRGFNTPKQIAYIEERSCGLLQGAYYISEEDTSPPIRKALIDVELFDRALAQDFAKFVAKLHTHGILHHDLNSTNVLFQKSETIHYTFSVIDINRMTFFEKNQPPSKHECFENLTRFTGRMDLYEYVIIEYLKARNWSDKNLKTEALDVKLKHDRRRLKQKAFFAKFKRKKQRKKVS